MKKILASAAVALGFAALAVPASAGCYYGCSLTQGAEYDSGVMGGAENEGATYGGLGMVGSITTKSLEAGGAATEYGASAWSRGNFTTDGFAAALSGGYGPQAAGSQEFGSAGVTGGASTTEYFGWGN